MKKKFAMALMEAITSAVTPAHVARL